MKKRYFIMIAAVLFLIGLCCSGITADAKKITAAQKRDYKNALSAAIRDGVEKKNMDVYARIAKSEIGKTIMKEAAIENRAALMAEGIDFLDSNWSHYYSIKSNAKHTVFRSTKMLSRRTYKRRYQDIMQGLQEVLSCVEPGMKDADKAMAVYYYLAKNTSYIQSDDCHTGYDVLVNHTGVCDGLANAYALAMNTLGVPCAVVSSYRRDHSWNMVKLNGLWYLCDLTSGSGTGEHEGMIVGYAGCLVGVDTFLHGHTGYTIQDIYGEGNSDGLDISRLSLASEDYIPNRSSIRISLASKPCLFYEAGYWYWISTGNMLKCSLLNGENERIVYRPAADQYIGWAEEYEGQIYISLNEKIYTMGYDGVISSLVRTITEREYIHELSSYFWRLAYVGRFHKNADGTLGYYVTDLRRARKGTERIAIPPAAGERNRAVLCKGRKTLRAGCFRQMYVMNASPGNVRNIRWSSSKPSVASVTPTGLVQAKRKGTAVITAVVNGKTIKCRIKVKGYTIKYRKEGRNSSKNVLTASGKKKILLSTSFKDGYLRKVLKK